VLMVPLALGFQFMGLGDWGGDDKYPYYTQAQKTAAAGMAKIAASLDAQFVVAAGDNFYHQGVKNVEDQRFQTTFEEIYNGQALEVPWYVTSGNHDHYGNVSAQWAYSQISKRWNFPSAYHDHTFSVGNGKVLHIVMIDTIILSGNLVTEDVNDTRYFDQPIGPEDQNAADDQWTWIEQTLNASTADYLYVVGHFPVWSVCEHGPTEILTSKLRPLLQKYEAHYISGHDHCQSHIVEDDIHYILTGMGDECCYADSNYHKNPANSVQWYISKEKNPTKAISGFTSFNVSLTGVDVSFYDQDGNVLYQTGAIPPRYSRTQ